MNKTIEALEQWGCDTAGGLERTVGDEELYIQCCEILYADMDFAALGKSIKDRNSEQAFDQAHSLKGVCANLGITPVYNKVVIITELLRSGVFEGTEELYVKMMQDYRTFCAIMDSTKH